MKNALGLIEFKTIPIAVYAVDEMLKAAKLEVVFSAPTCPGKYIAIISGEVSDVELAISRGQAAGGTFLIASYVISNVSQAVFPALTGTVNAPGIEALGMIETISAISAVKAGDIAVKAANIKLLEIRLARGLGGKGEIFYSGEISAVETATKAAQDALKEEGVIVSSAVIARPAPGLIEAIS
jgi:microcompartment protein CcmL/EutN